MEALTQLDHLSLPDNTTNEEADHYVNPLFALLKSITKLQEDLEYTQQAIAQTINFLSTDLMDIYSAANKVLDELMKEGDEKTHHKPKEGGDDWPTKIQVWQTYYNMTNQKYQQLEAQKNTVVQTDTQEEQVISEAAKTNTALSETAIAPSNKVARLLEYDK